MQGELIYQACRCRDYLTTTVVTLGILALALAVRLYQIDVQVVWHDEAFSVWLARMSPARAIFLTAHDVHPPLYYLLLHAWMSVFGDGLLAVRGLSVVMGVMTVGMAMLLAHQLASWQVAVRAGLLLALYPIAVYYSQETRMYALLGMLMFSALLALLLWVRRQQDRYLVAYALLMIGGLYTHYFALLCALACWLYLLSVKGGNGQRLLRSRRWWLCNLVIALAYLPWVPSVLGQLAQAEHYVGWIAPVTAMSIPLAVWRAFTLGIDSEPSNLLAVLLLLALMMTGIHLARRDTDPSKPRVMLVFYCFMPVLVAWLLSYAMSLFMERYLLFALQGLPVLLAVAIGQLKVKSQIWLMAACVSLQGAGLLHLYGRDFNLQGSLQWANNRLDAVMADVQHRWEPGDAVMTDGGGWWMTVDFYNKTGTATLLYTPYPFYSSTWVYPASAQQIVSDPLTLAGRPRRIWWVSSGPTAEIERLLAQKWALLTVIVKGDSRALLFAPGAP